MGGGQGVFFGHNFFAYEPILMILFCVGFSIAPRGSHFNLIGTVVIQGRGGGETGGSFLLYVGHNIFVCKPILMILFALGSTPRWSHFNFIGRGVISGGGGWQGVICMHDRA